MSSKLSFNVTSGRDTDDAVEDILLKAGEYFTDGDLEGAVKELSNLPEKESKCLNDFMKKLKERVFLEQAVRTIQSHVALLSLSMC